MLKLKHFLTVADKFGKPGFAQLLGTSPKTILDSLSSSRIPSSHDDSHRIRDKIMIETSSIEEYPYSFPYKIPHHACVPILKDDKITQQLNLPLSGYLALFDDYTTLALVNEDKKTRPGLSVLLSAQLHPGFISKLQHKTLLPHAGDEVNIDVRVIKIGKIFGFAEAKAICSVTGETIATGMHIKYLPGGSMIHRIALDPKILPLTAKLASILQNTSLSSYNNEDGSNVQNRMDEALAMIDNDEYCFEVKNHHCNPVESLHVSFKS